ncbi:MAG: hypothetical protein GY802_29730 [Gammaproteobacteria bacterium]|nr:hypothetical protein [Gammaproteobacteria bacterium]
MLIAGVTSDDGQQRQAARRAPFLQLLPQGFRTEAYRSTDATVFVATEGSGRTTIDDQEFAWGPRDILVAPSWKWIVHEADDETVSFSYSDRVAQQKLGFWREQRDQARKTL